MSRHLEVTFCDDIREEVGGKLSFMGIYSNDMIVPGFPFVLPKLCIAVNVVSSIEAPVEHLQINLCQDGFDSPIIATDPFQPPPRPDASDDAAWQVVTMMLVLAPFQIDKATKLRVIAKTEEGDLRGRSLRIVCANT
jgi:hypothetical protein